MRRSGYRRSVMCEPDALPVMIQRLSSSRGRSASTGAGLVPERYDPAAARLRVEQLVLDVLRAQELDLR